MGSEQPSLSVDDVPQNKGLGYIYTLAEYNGIFRKVSAKWPHAGLLSRKISLSTDPLMFTGDFPVF